eukprot:CAMPEP_0172479112 /NCGR_PEP_ID=MMETSP1066-20121228/3480_1 /TAXON_ID=671091 /ORGANISM="Coscinodiscus wailesii, Strain CCMP2513" /LENGTH=228 /DNA_ID=CAMNT_0013239285 /DNA_START=46 /DNA_END=732 /DNA_ORIENTATION=+
MTLLRTITKSLIQQSHHRTQLTKKDTEHQNLLRKHRDETDETRRNLQNELTKTQKLLRDAHNRQSVMYDTLVNHKRESLVKHKTRSQILAAELDDVGRRRVGLLRERDREESELRRIEESVKELEDKLQRLLQSQKSGGGGGSSSSAGGAHARKKRRLDEEYEMLLESMDAKRETIAEIDGRLTALAAEKEEKDDEMKVLEGVLVQVLVEQQKMLLEILSECGAAGRR